MKFKNIISITLVFALISSILNVGVFSQELERIEFEPKIYSDATIEQNFCDDSVLVVMDKKVGEQNKKHNIDFFGNIPIKEIVDLTEITADVVSLDFARQDGDMRGIKEIVADRIAVSKNDENFRQILQIKLPINSKENVLEVIKRLQKIDGIISASPDYIGTPGLISNDPRYSNQWSLPKINMPSAWNITTGNSGVRVGVLDTGITAHNDLNANLNSALGWNFINNNNSTSDSESHGTHVAGIIGAVGNNNTGISGACWNTTLVPLKFNGNISQVTAALNRAKNNNIPIVNMSWWDFGNDSALRQAIANYHGLFVCIAGNSGTNIDVTPNYPASFNLPNMIVVGATDSNDERSVWRSGNSSNYGAQTVDIYAPGSNILSTVPTSVSSTGYASMGGTSMAAPHVAGVAALILSRFPGASTKQIKDAILLGSNWINIELPNGTTTSVKRLNAHSALMSTLYSGGIYRIKNVATNTYLNMVNPTAASNLRMTSSNSLQWVMQSMGGAYSFELRCYNPISNSIGRVAKPTTVPSIATVGTTAHTILAIPGSDGSVKLWANGGVPDMVLASNGTNVQWQASNNSNSQKWILEPSFEFARGDINKDGKVNNSDLLEIQMYMEGMSASVIGKSSVSFYLADMDGNGKITQIDVNMILSII